MKIVQTSNPLEIKSVLLEAKEQGKQFMIWQRDVNNILLFQVKAKLQQVHKEDVFQFNMEEEVEINPKLPVFFAVADSTLVFKTSEVQNAKTLMLLRTPEEAKYKERRRHDRKKFKSKERKDVEITFESLDPNKPAPPKVLTHMLDISEGGLCIALSKEVYENIDLTRPVTLKCLASDVQLESDHAQIMNSRPYKGPTMGHGNLLAIGLMFVIKSE